LDVVGVLVLVVEAAATVPSAGLVVDEAAGLCTTGGVVEVAGLGEGVFSPAQPIREKSHPKNTNVMIFLNFLVLNTANTPYFVHILVSPFTKKPGRPGLGNKNKWICAAYGLRHPRFL